MILSAGFAVRFSGSVWSGAIKALPKFLSGGVSLVLVITSFLQVTSTHSFPYNRFLAASGAFYKGFRIGRCHGGYYTKNRGKSQVVYFNQRF